MLDPGGKAEVLAAARELRDEGLAVVYVTQEMDEVVGADRAVALEQGVVVYSGGVPDLFGDGGLVRRLGLGLPAAGELALELAARGRVVAPLPLTIDGLLDALRRAP
jgi:ABC-type multidrug transport system ATPase subunit